MDTFDRGSNFSNGATESFTRPYPRLSFTPIDTGKLDGTVSDDK